MDVPYHIPKSGQISTARGDSYLGQDHRWGMLWICQGLGNRVIKFEHNSLVLDSSHSKEDQLAVNDFVEYKLKEQEQLLVAKFSGNQERQS